MRGRTGLAVVIATLGAMVGGAATAAADRAIDRPAFTATPAELLAAAKAAPDADADAHAFRITLRHEHDTSFDAQGRATVRDHHIYVIPPPHKPAADPAAAAGGDDDEDDEGGPDHTISVAESWRPSFQDRPTVRARVIEPDGAVHELDPAKVEDVALDAKGPKSDWSLVSGSLPWPPAGSVVETEVVVRDREPPLGGGSAWTPLLDEPGTTLIYSVPVGHRLRRVERNLPAGIQVRHSIAGGRERWIYDVPAQREETRERTFEIGMPGGTTPAIGVTTAPSWAAVARAYSAVIDRRIADGPIVLPASLPRGATRPTVDAITAWLRERVHPAPLEFSRAPLTPQPPAAVLTRGALSSLDVATLLVAVLRRAGVRAHLALTASGIGNSDVDPDLPALRQLTRVLVRARLATGDVWIDLSDELIAPGRLAIEVQGHHALVIADDTTGLIMTPAPAAGDNLTHETRTFTAAEQGFAGLTIASRVTGTFDTTMRHMFRSWTGSQPAGKATAGREYYGGTLVRLTPSAAADLATPFTLTQEIKDSRRVYSSGDRIRIELPAREVLIHIPAWMREKPPAARVHDYVWRSPHVHEIENRIELPPGFAPPVPPADHVAQLGAAAYRVHNRVEGQTLIVTQRFDSGKLRWTAAELTELRERLAEVAATQVVISVDRTSFALREAGKYREAAAEDARMIALHPQEALHHDHLAELYIDAGLGDAARREARKAVELAPSSPDTLAMLGWVLDHDRLGRDFRSDWDRAGAIEALRKARAIDPHDSGAAFELAQILERNPSGALYARGADMAGAIEAWTAARERAGDPDDVALRLAEVLLWAGQPIAAETLARTVPASEWRDILIVTATADTQGATAAIAEAGKLRSGDERRALIGDATWVEIDRRRYDLARALFAATPGSDKLSEFWTTMLPRLAARPDPAPGSADPRTALDELFVAMPDPARKTDVFLDARVARAMYSDARRSMQEPSHRGGAQVLISDMLRAAGYQLDGGDGVWRATPAIKRVGFSPYLALDHGRVKAIGTSARYGLLGHYALGLDLGDATSAARARRLLDLLRRDLDADTAYRPTLFRKIWGSGKPTGRDAIELAAAILAGDLERDRGAAIAARCAPASADAKLVCHAILASSHDAHGRPADALREYEALAAADPSLLTFVLGSHAHALAQLGRWADAEKLVDGFLAAHPGHGLGVMMRYQLAVLHGDAAEAARRLEALSQLPKPEGYQLNAAAWNQLLPGGDLVRGREIAKKAVEVGRYNPAVHNTLAAIEAELGDVAAAVRDGRESVALDDGNEPTAADWCVVARIAEQLGQTDDAIAIYRKYARPAAEPITIAAYAARRLAALHAP